MDVNINNQELKNNNVLKATNNVAMANGDGPIYGSTGSDAL